MRSSAPWTSPCTVRRPGCAAQPAKGAPSYAMVRRMTPTGRRWPLYQLEEDHLGRIRPARAELHDPRVAAGALRVTRGHLLEELVNEEAVLPQLRHAPPARVQVAALGERDELLDLGLDGLRLRLRCLDPLVLDQIAREVAQQRPAVGRVAGELVPLLAVTHGRNASGATPAAARARSG